MAAEDWRVVCDSGEVAPGDMKRVDLEDLPAIAVFNLDGTFHVTAARCTHAEACLTEGTLHGDVIECPFHGGSFQVQTGEAVSRPAKKPLQVFETDVRDGAVVIRVP
jgi:ethylbenzene dioxygenase ferredoxin subunit